MTTIFITTAKIYKNLTDLKTLNYALWEL